MGKKYHWWLLSYSSFSKDGNYYEPVRRSQIVKTTSKLIERKQTVGYDTVSYLGKGTEREFNKQ